MSIIGVDYGSLNITVAQAAGQGDAAGGRKGINIVLNEGSGRFTPNLASFEDQTRLAGALAKPKMRSNYKNTITLVKRLIGRKYSDPDVQKTLKYVHFKTEQLESDEIGCVVQFEGKRQVFLPEQIVAMQLANVKSFTQKYSGGVVTDIVLSVPVYFTDNQRKAMLDACKIAGLNCYRLINETTATALQYGILRKSRFDENGTTVLFLDMGYSDFQAAVVTFTTKGMCIKSTAHDQNFGSFDIDYKIAEHINEQFMKKNKIDLRKHPKSWIKLMMAAEKAKKTMSPVGVNKAMIRLECLYKEIDFSGVLTIDDLEKLTKDLMPKIDTTIKTALAQAGLMVKDLHSCEAMGGAVRMRFARQTIANLIGEDKLSSTLNQDECTARGCAIMCAMLSPQIRVLPFEIKDQVRTPIKLKWQQTNAADAMDVDDRSAGENSLVIFKKTDAFPKEMKLTFKRTKTFSLDAVYEDMSGLPKGSSDTIGSFAVKMDNATKAVVEAQEAGEKPEVRVFVNYDANGIVGINRAEFMKKNKQPEPEPEEEVAAAPEAAAAAEAAPEAAAADAEKPASGEAKGNDDDKASSAADSKTEGAPTKEGDASGEADASAKDSSAKDADAKDDKDKAEPPAKKKAKKKAKKIPKYTCIQLEVVRSTPFGLEKKQLDNLVHLEANMQNNARILLERDEARNSLESFVYDFRDKLEDEEVQDFMTADFKEKFFAQLDATEEWLYTDEGFDSAKKVFTTKYSDLSKDASAVGARQAEFNARPDAIKVLRKAIDDLRALAAASTTDETKKHWDDKDRKVLLDACDAADKWFDSKIPALANLPKHEDPPTKFRQILDREQELRRACDTVVNKKVPPPPPAEPVKEEKKAEAEKAPPTDAAADATKAEPEAAKDDAPAADAAPADGDKMDTEA